MIYRGVWACAGRGGGGRRGTECVTVWRGRCVRGFVGVILYVSVGGKCVYIYMCVHIWGGGG